MAKRPGKLKERVQVWRSVLTQDAMGGSTDVPVLRQETYAQVQIDNGSRGLEYLQARNLRPYIITMRENVNLEINPNSDYLVWDGKRLTITSVDSDPDKLEYRVIRATRKIV